jgi:hypothetical protein
MCDAIQAMRTGGGPFLDVMKKNAFLTIERDFSMQKMLEDTFKTYR